MYCLCMSLLCVFVWILLCVFMNLCVEDGILGYYLGSLCFEFLLFVFSYWCVEGDILG